MTQHQSPRPYLSIPHRQNMSKDNCQISKRKTIEAVNALFQDKVLDSSLHDSKGNYRKKHVQRDNCAVSPVSKSEHSDSKKMPIKTNKINYCPRQHDNEIQPFHSGAWQFNQIENSYMWTCCMSSNLHSRGCEIY